MCFFSGRLNLTKRYINKQIWIGLGGSRNLHVTICKLQFVMWNQQFTVCNQQFTVCNQQFVLYF